MIRCVAPGNSERVYMSAKPTSPPISSHPAFPAAVALWFALLLGLGFFVVPPSSLEGIVEATGIAAIVPSAAPPLGGTARIAISVFAALVGVALGLFVAWRVIQSQSARPENDDAAQQAERLRTVQPAFAEDEEDALEDDLAMFAEDTDPVDDNADRDRSAWESWREEMGADSFDDMTDERDEDTVGKDTTTALAVSDHDAAETVAAEGNDLPPETSEAVVEEHPVDVPAENASAVEWQDEDHRLAADMLVAGLPRIEREELGEEPIAAWLEDSNDEEPDFSPAAADEGEVEDRTFEASDAGDQDTISHAPLAVPVGEPTSEDPVANADPSPDGGESGDAAQQDRSANPANEGESFASFSLDQLVSRLETAMSRYDPAPSAPDAQDVDTAQPPQPEAPRAQVIDFQSRERPGGVPQENDPAPNARRESQQSLRAALDKLSHVSSQF